MLVAALSKAEYILKFYRQLTRNITKKTAVFHRFSTFILEMITK